MGELIDAYHQFNCDNHITEGAYEKLQESNSQLEKVGQMVEVRIQIPGSQRESKNVLEDFG